MVARVCRMLTASSVPQDVTSDIKIFPNDEGLNGAQLESLEGIINTEAVFAGVLADLVKVLLDELLLLDELDVRKRFSGKFDRLDDSTSILSLKM